MNELVKELAEQAGYKPLGTFADELMEIYNKKFAELVVLECAQIADDCVVLGRDFPGEYIKDYFGVE